MSGPAAVLERRLFEIVGGWVPSVPEADAKLLLRAHSFQHAWHAELWDELGPAVDGSVDAALGAAVEALAAAPDETRERLVRLYRLALPRVVEWYRARRAAAPAATGGPLVRALGLMLVDDEVAIGEGERLIAGLRQTAVKRPEMA